MTLVVTIGLFVLVDGPRLLGRRLGEGLRLGVVGLLRGSNTLGWRLHFKLSTQGMNLGSYWDECFISH